MRRRFRTLTLLGVAAVLLVMVSACGMSREERKMIEHQRNLEKIQSWNPRVEVRLPDRGERVLPKWFSMTLTNEDGSVSAKTSHISDDHRMRPFRNLRRGDKKRELSARLGLYVEENHVLYDSAITTPSGWHFDTLQMPESLTFMLTDCVIFRGRCVDEGGKPVTVKYPAIETRSAGSKHWSLFASLLDPVDSELEEGRFAVAVPSADEYRLSFWYKNGSTSIIRSRPTGDQEDLGTIALAPIQKIRYQLVSSSQEFKELPLFVQYETKERGVYEVETLKSSKGTLTIPPMGVRASERFRFFTPQGLSDWYQVATLPEAGKPLIAELKPLPKGKLTVGHDSVRPFPQADSLIRVTCIAGALRDVEYDLPLNGEMDLSVELGIGTYSIQRFFEKGTSAESQATIIEVLPSKLHRVVPKMLEQAQASLTMRRYPSEECDRLMRLRVEIVENATTEKFGVPRRFERRTKDAQDFGLLSLVAGEPYFLRVTVGYRRAEKSEIIEVLASRGDRTQGYELSTIVNRLWNEVKREGSGFDAYSD